MQAGAQGDALDSGRKRLVQTHAQRLARRVHGELFHAVDEDHARTAFGFHRLADMQTRGFGHLAEVEFHGGLVGIVEVVGIQLQLFLDEIGVITTIRHRRQHGIRDMSHATQSRGFQCQFGGGNIHAHPANHDWYQLLLAKAQAKIIHTFHCYPSISNQGITLSLGQSVFSHFLPLKSKKPRLKRLKNFTRGLAYAEIFRQTISEMHE
jgi:hypothetical protein